MKKLDTIIRPLCEEMKEKRENFPVTIVYVANLESLGYFFELQMLVGLCYDISCHKMWPVLPFSVLLCPSFLNRCREFQREEDLLPAFQ